MVVNGDDLIASGIAKDNHHIYYGIDRLATDTDNPILQRLPHDLQNTSIELRQLIQAEELAPLQQPYSQP